MPIVSRLIGLAAPAAGLRRAMRLSEQGQFAEAFRLFTRSAGAGIAEAEYHVARCYLEGAGVPPSRAEGARWLERAATHGHVEAQSLLGALCVHGLADGLGSGDAERLFVADEPGNPDFGSALKWARQAAEAGSAKGQAVLAYVLSCGPEPLRDPEAAHRWYARSAAAGCPEGCLGYALSLAPRSDDEAGRREVVAHLRRAAAAELPTAIYLLAMLTEQGVGVARDQAAALLLYRQAAEHGQRAAQVRWGLALMEGGAVEQDPVSGESWLRRAALAGDPQAAAWLGDFYVRNGRLPPNYTEAANWYRRAAAAGHTAAAHALGSLYLTGAGVARDPDEAALWFTRAAEAGDAHAQADLATLLQTGAVSALTREPPPVGEWFARAAEQGDPIGAFNYAVCLAEGVAVPRDDAAAVFWLKRAAGHVVDAQYWYGRMLAAGRGVARDDAEAAAWFARAAEAGMTEAQVALGELHVAGRGVARDHRAAKSWFLRAVPAAHAGAMFALGALYGGGHDIETDREEARRWFARAAEHDHPIAALMLARYAVRGLGGPRDIAAGRSWYAHAAQLGVPEAAEELAVIEAAMPPDPARAAGD